ncbi:MAG: hypothetical protein ABI411_09655 [Tahibacter sp.]
MSRSSIAAGVVFVLASGASLSCAAQSNRDPRVQPPVEKRDMPKSEGFDALDTNRNGYLEKDELAPDAARQHNFEKYDADGDHRLSREEWMNGPDADAPNARR